MYTTFLTQKENRETDRLLRQYRGAHWNWEKHNKHYRMILYKYSLVPIARHGSFANTGNNTKLGWTNLLLRISKLRITKVGISNTRKGKKSKNWNNVSIWRCGYELVETRESQCTIYTFLQEIWYQCEFPRAMRLLIQSIQLWYMVLSLVDSSFHVLQKS